MPGAHSRYIKRDKLFLLFPVNYNLQAQWYLPTCSQKVITLWIKWINFFFWVLLNTSSDGWHYPSAPTNRFKADTYIHGQISLIEVFLICYWWQTYLSLKLKLLYYNTNSVVSKKQIVMRYQMKTVLQSKIWLFSLMPYLHKTNQNQFNPTIPNVRI